MQAGPKAPYDKNKLVLHVDEFADEIADYARSQGIQYDMIHSHYWLSGLVAHKLQEMWDVPFVQMFHTLGEMKNSVAKNEIDLEVSARIAGERR